jgi:hypothetical protein
MAMRDFLVCTTSSAHRFEIVAKCCISKVKEARLRHFYRVSTACQRLASLSIFSSKFQPIGQFQNSLLLLAALYIIIEPVIAALYSILPPKVQCGE